jgi:hypothetical protein
MLATRCPRERAPSSRTCANSTSGPAMEPRHIDECCDDVVFFADEAGAWQIPV